MKIYCKIAGESLQKLRVLVKYYRFGRHIGGDDYPDIRLAVARGTLL